MKAIHEIYELKVICCSKTERTQGLRTGGFSRDELRKSQSTANQVTVQIQELQDRINCLSASRDF